MIKNIKICIMLAILSTVAISCKDKEGDDSADSGYVNGHEYVDLGLSVKWATCNVGASSMSDSGSYYAWGEKETKLDYADIYSTTYGKGMSDISGDLAYDVARAKWGGTWRMPTKAEFEELSTQCSWKWTTQGGKYGYLITGPSDNSIFLPAAGWKHSVDTYRYSEFGYYWTSTPNDDDNKKSYYMDFSSVDRGVYSYQRYDGLQIRAVTQ